MRPSTTLEDETRLPIINKITKFSDEADMIVFIGSPLHDQMIA
jgi:hypothetical protein